MIPMSKPMSTSKMNINTPTEVIQHPPHKLGRPTPLSRVETEQYELAGDSPIRMPIGTTDSPGFKGNKQGRQSPRKVDDYRQSFGKNIENSLRKYVLNEDSAVDNQSNYRAASNKVSIPLEANAASMVSSQDYPLAQMKALQNLSIQFARAGLLPSDKRKLMQPGGVFPKPRKPFALIKKQEQPSSIIPAIQITDQSRDEHKRAALK